jgi:catechol 2,3-dioxygenase
MPASVSKIGHIVLKVEDLDTALAFTAASSALRKSRGETSAKAPWPSSRPATPTTTLASSPRTRRTPGPARCTISRSKSVTHEDLRHVKQALAAKGIVVHMSLDHRVSQGIYISDPDGNPIELYVDADERLWRHDPSLVANSEPLNL